MRSLFYACAIFLAGCSTLTIEADMSQHVSGQWTVKHGEHDISGEPMARVAVTLQPKITQELTAIIGIEHNSFPTIHNDRGDERAIVGLRWQPFSKP